MARPGFTCPAPIANSLGWLVSIHYWFPQMIHHICSCHKCGFDCSWGPFWMSWVKQSSNSTGVGTSHGSPWHDSEVHSSRIFWKATRAEILWPSSNYDDSQSNHIQLEDCRISKTWSFWGKLSYCRCSGFSNDGSSKYDISSWSPCGIHITICPLLVSPIDLPLTHYHFTSNFCFWKRPSYAKSTALSACR